MYIYYFYPKKWGRGQSHEKVESIVANRTTLFDAKLKRVRNTTFFWNNGFLSAYYTMIFPPLLEKNLSYKKEDDKKNESVSRFRQNDFVKKIFQNGV